MHDHKRKAKSTKRERRTGERGRKMRAKGRKGWRRRGSWRRERERDRQRDYARDVKPERGKGWEVGRTREMRYRLQPADKSKVIGPSGILRSRTTKSTASSRYVATYVHMYQDHVRDVRMSEYVLALLWLRVYIAQKRGVCVYVHVNLAPAWLTIPSQYYWNMLAFIECAVDQREHLTLIVFGWRTSEASALW